MSNKVFCGNLPWGIGDPDLEAAMTEFGPVKEARVVTDRDTGKSRGFGFVTFEDEEAAQKAVLASSIKIEGRTIRIDEATDRERGGGGGGGGGGAGGRGAPRGDDRPKRGRSDGRKRDRY